MPHHYKVTGNHGQGAETIMRTEAWLNVSRFNGILTKKDSEMGDSI